MNPIGRILVFLAALTGIAALAQQDYSAVEIKTMPVAGKVYMLEGRGGNIGLSVGDDGVLMIDDQFAPLADKIKAAIAKLGGGKPRFLLNTHWHSDHTGGNADFGKDSTIIAHDNVRRRLQSRQQLMGRNVEPQPPHALPVVTFEDAVTLHFNGEEVRVRHLPKGHTDGDSVVFFTGSNVVHMGDLMFNGSFPFIDLESGGDVEGYARNVATILKELKPDVKIIPGHGPLAGVDDLKKFHAMLVESIAFVKKGIADGKTAADLKTSVPESWKPWGGGFINSDKWIEILYDSLSG